VSTVSDRTSTRSYYAAFAGLVTLTALTVALAFVDLGGLNNIAALVIAASKAAVVAAFFMHVRRSSPLVRATIAAGCVWLAILIGLTSSDFLTRSW
jgi:cytochrome c oxidase subunit 4